LRRPTAARIYLKSGEHFS